MKALNTVKYLRNIWVITCMVGVLLINPLVANAQSKLNAFCIRNKAATVPDCVRLMKKSGYYFLGAETSTSRATCTVGTTPPSGAALKQGSKVYVLGDSITAIAGSSYIAAFSQSGITATVDGSSSRSIVGKGVDGNKLSGLEAVASTEGKAAIASADAIIIALGTNGSNTTKNMADLMAAIRANSKSNVPMYWVDTTVIGKPDYLPVIKATNVAIYAQAQPSALNFTPISWYKTVTPGGDPQEPKATDTDINKYIVQANQFVHPTTAGVAALTSAVVKSVTQPTAATATGTGLSLPTGTEITGNFYGGTKILPPTWIPILNAAGNDVGVDPAFLAAILGNETSWLPPEVFLQNPNHSSHGTISGPFQFAATTAATFKKNLALDGNKDGVVDEKNPFDAAYMAAAYLKSMGASMTIPLGNTGDYAVSRSNSDGKVTVRTVAAHYNQGGGFNAPTAKTAAEVDAKAIGGNIVSKYMDQAQQNTEALRKLEGVGGAVGTGAQCTATASLDFKSYSQYDPRWKDEPYGILPDGSASTIAAGGCGPSAMAMIITALTGAEYTPLDAAKYGRENGTEDGSGGSLARPLATKLASFKGLTAIKVPTLTVEYINSILSGGGMVLMGGQGSNPFTTAGHYIVIRGVSASGKWIIGDSNIPANNTTEFDAPDILTKAKLESVYAITK